MPFYRVGGVMMHVKMTNTAKRPATPACCARILIAGIPRRCLQMADHACDWPLEDGGTCDAPLCAEHAHRIGPDKHLCPIHRAQRQRQTPELFE